MGQTVPNILDHPQFSVDDFNSRWKAARIAAFRDLMPEIPLGPGVSESGLLAQLPTEKRDQALRAVFDNSRRLGLSLVRWLGLTFESADFRQVLSQVSDVPCLSARWSLHNDAWVARREGCRSASAHGSMVCDWYREAIDGLVMGAGQDERFARHASAGHGDGECVDVYFSDAPVGEPLNLRYGPIPDDMGQALAPVVRKFGQMKKNLEFMGFSEGTLFYKLTSDDNTPLCGAGAKITHGLLYKEVHAVFPAVRMQDASPLAVYAEGTR